MEWYGNPSHFLLIFCLILLSSRPVGFNPSILKANKSLYRQAVFQIIIYPPLLPFRAQKCLSPVLMETEPCLPTNVAKVLSHLGHVVWCIRLERFFFRDRKEVRLGEDPISDVRTKRRQGWLSSSVGGRREAHTAPDLIRRTNSQLSWMKWGTLETQPSLVAPTISPFSNFRLLPSGRACLYTHTKSRIIHILPFATELCIILQAVLQGLSTFSC